MIDKNLYTIYENSDGRLRVYNKKTKKVTSYPRLLMENQLGRTLKPTEDIHHKDGDPRNNSLDNLEVINKSDHVRHHSTKHYFSDKEMICPVCGEEFMWTAEQQRTKHRNNNRKDKKTKNAGPFCSRRCVGLYGRSEQLRWEAKIECE